MKIFRPGTFVDRSGKRVTLTPDQLAQTAKAYNPALKAAPIVLGHPKDDTPSFGQIQSLQFEDGFLKAVPGATPPKFAEFAEAAYLGVSAAFYEPTSPYNPTPGTYYLRHVGLTNLPAVDGLDSPQFAEFADNGEGVVEFAMKDYTIASLFAGLRDFMIAQFGQETADRVLPMWSIDDLKLTATSEVMEYAEAEAPQASTQETEFSQREQQLREREVELDRRDFLGFAQGLLNDGRQFSADLAADLFMQMGDGSIAFSEGESIPSREAFKRFLSGLPKVVEFGEVAPASEAIEPEELSPVQVAQRITAYREGQASKGRSISFSQAAAELESSP